MNCPNCNHPDTHVIDSRSKREGKEIRRRRACPSCEHRFTTYERAAEDRPPMIIKGDGRREPLNRDKLRSGIQKACEKRDISTQQIEEAVSRVVRKVQDYNRDELASRIVGDFVMEELIELDDIAYIRFASVYWRFGDISEFTRHVEELQSKRKKQHRR